MNKEVTTWIIVPVFNRAEKIHNFINQILSQTYQNFRLIIVDHGTVDIDYSVFDDSRIGVLKQSSELWWTGAVNVGVRYVLEESTCGEDFILVINDDVRFDDNYLQLLVDVGMNHPGAVVGSVCVKSDTGRVMSTGFSLDRLRARFVAKYAGRWPDDIPDALIPSDVLSGRGMLVPPSVFRTIGLFDEGHLPHYGADNEFSWRARKRGFDLVVGTRCVVITEPRNPPLVRPTTTVMDFITDTRKSGNLPAVVAFASLCFSRPYALYYTGVHFMRCLLSYGKRSLMQLYRVGDS